MGKNATNPSLKQLYERSIGIIAFSLEKCTFKTSTATKMIEVKTLTTPNVDKEQLKLSYTVGGNKILQLVVAGLHKLTRANCAHFFPS